MGKNKDKKAKRTGDVFLEMSPNSSYVPESPQQLALSTDTDSSVVGSPRRLEMFTCSTEKSKKKQKKRDLAAQECENKSSEFQTEGEQEHGKKPKKRHKSRDCETPSNKPAELYSTDMVNGLAAETSHHEEPPRKKKKKDKLRQTEETVAPAESESEVSRKKKKKKRSRDEVEEMNVTLKSDENEIMTDERTGDSKKKKKKKKEKDHQIQMFESAASSAQSVLENGFNASTETGEKQEENIQVKKKKEKKKRHKEKQNQSQILGSPTTAAAQSVQQNGSTDLQETEDVNVSAGPEESPSKKGKKTKATPKNGGLKTRQTQTIPKTITPKTEQAEEVSVNEWVQIGTGFGTKKNDKKERVSKEIDRRLLEELKQFVPNVESRVRADIIKMIQYDLPRYKEFQKKGIRLNHGRFTVTENEILKKNVEDFLALTGIDSGTKLFYSQHFEEENSAIKRLKKNHRFFEAIARGIPRSCHDIYTRGRKIFDDSTYKGRFTQAELDQLCKLQTLHGNNWKKISALTGRSAVSLEKRYSQLTKRSGVWSKKELQRLLGAVREYIISQVQPRPSNIGSLRVTREMLYKGLPYSKISEKVKTRSWIKCREKWMSILAAKVSSEDSGVNKRTTNEGRIMLIKAMYQMQAEDVADVDWDQLSALFGDVPPSYVQKKWNRLKVCFVPNWQSKCFADTIDFLYHKVLPCFESNGLYLPDYDITQLKEAQAKNFLFKDIFPDVSDQDDDDDDDDDEEEEAVVVSEGEEVKD